MSRPRVSVDEEQFGVHGPAGAHVGGPGESADCAAPTTTRCRPGWRAEPSDTSSSSHCTRGVRSHGKSMVIRGCGCNASTPLDRQGRRAGRQYPPGPVPQQHLLRYQAGLDDLVEAHVVGYQQRDTGHPQRPSRARSPARERREAARSPMPGPGVEAASSSVGSMATLSSETTPADRESDPLSDVKRPGRHVR